MRSEPPCPPGQARPERLLTQPAGTKLGNTHNRIMSDVGSEEEDIDLEQADNDTLRLRLKEMSKKFKKVVNKNKKLSAGIQEVTTIVEKAAPDVSLHVLKVEVMKVKTQLSVEAPELQVSMLPSDNGAEKEAQSDAKQKSTTKESYLHLG